MEDFFATHNDPSAGFFGESLVDAAQGIEEGFESAAMSTSAAPPTGRRVIEGSESAAMSAPGAPPSRRRKVAVTRNKQANFTAYEDKVLCKAWLEISCDAVTNTGQRKEAFWARVHSRYNSKRGTYPERTSKSLIGRWDIIKAEVSKFGGYVADKIRSNPSGMTDADKSVAAAADFADIEKHNFTLMHCWQILKDEPKWHELKRKIDTPQNSGSRENVLTTEQRHFLDLDPDDSSPATSAGKRPMGRDAAKAAKKKKAASASSEHASKMHDLSAQKFEMLKVVEVERKVRLDEMVTLEKQKVEEAREHRQVMLELEKQRLAMEEKRLQMEAEKKQREEERKEKEEDERILAINLDQCQPMQRIYYEALQQDILHKLMSRRQGPSL